MRQRTTFRNVLVALLVAGAAWSAASCGGPPVDLAKALKVTDAVTGWYDAGIVEGQEEQARAQHLVPPD